MHLGQKAPGRIALAVALTLAASTAARADITTSFSGFGTVGGSFTSDSDYTYSHDASEFTKASNQFDIGLESRLGLQGSADFGNGFSITAQEVFRERGSDEFDPGTEWLYVQYSPESDLQIRLGRVVIPVFLFSDSRQVGYAAPWFRSPNEVYGAVSFRLRGWRPDYLAEICRSVLVYLAGHHRQHEWNIPSQWWFDGRGQAGTTSSTNLFRSPMVTSWCALHRPLCSPRTLCS
jgi:hypothetical protein